MYTYTLELLKINELNICENTNNLYASEIQDKNLLNIKTYYEQQWLARGLTIKYLKFQQRQDEQPYIEPDIEIEYDTYRSYARNKRSELNFGK
jgi:tRNA (guanine-N7-)-methyltransferase